MVKNIEIGKVDEHFANVQSEENHECWVDPKTDHRIKVYGLNWFSKDKRYHRLPTSSDAVVEGLDGHVHILAANSSGGLLAFYSDTKVLKIHVKLRDTFQMGHMAYTGQGGFDLYCGDAFQNLKFYRTSNYDFHKNEYAFTFFDFPTKQAKKLYVLNFPLYATVSDVLIGVCKDSSIVPADSLFPNDGRIVFYGTSITQGGCASRPGMSYTQILSRHLGYECLNYGFSGNGKGHPEIADILGTIDDVKLFVLDYEANVTFERLQTSLTPFIKTIRKHYSTIPILLMSKITMSAEFHNETERELEHKIRDYQREFVKRQRENDYNIFYFDGSLLLGENSEEKTVDGVHPTDYGFASIAMTLEPVIKTLLS